MSDTQPPQTRQILLEIGLELFSTQTYEGVGVSDIVARAHVTKPTLYHHFGSKLGFYCAVFEHYCKPFFEKVASNAVFEHDFVHNLNTLAQDSLTFFMENPRVFGLLEYAAHVSQTAEHHDFVQKYWTFLNERIENLFEQAVVQHGNLKDKSKLSAWLFIHAVRAQIHLVLKDNPSYRPDLPYKLVHQFMYGLFA
jgi:TetR/AcrR family transcriptional regulator